MEIPIRAKNVILQNFFSKFAMDNDPSLTDLRNAIIDNNGDVIRTYISDSQERGDKQLLTVLKVVIEP